jgi:hypothetical protein
MRSKNNTATSESQADMAKKTTTKPKNKTKARKNVLERINPNAARPIYRPENETGIQIAPGHQTPRDDPRFTGAGPRQD